MIAFVMILIRPFVGIVILLVLLWLTPFYPTSDGATLNRLVGLIVLAAVLLPKVFNRGNRKSTFVFSSFDPPFAFFMFVVILTMLINMINISPNFPFERVSDLITGYLLYWLIVNVVDNWSQLRALFWLTIICALGLSIPTISLGMSASEFSMERISIEGNPNYYAFVFLLAILLSVWLLEHVNKPQKVILYLVILVLLTSIYFTGNRSSIMSLAVVVLLYGLLLRGAGIRNYLIPVGLIALASFWIVSQFTPILASRSLQFYSSENGIITNDAIRLQIYNGAFLIIAKYPFFGVGIGNATEFMKTYTGMRVSPHNLFLGVAIEAGIAGITSLLLMYYFVIKDLLKSVFATKRNSLDAKPDETMVKDVFHAIILIIGVNIIPNLTHGITLSRTWFVVFAFAVLTIRFITQGQKKTTIEDTLLT